LVGADDSKASKGVEKLPRDISNQEFVISSSSSNATSRFPSPKVKIMPSLEINM
jgi:hypothetical protein